jgi:microcystin-dependent protein
MTFWKWSKTAASNGTADSTSTFPKAWHPAASERRPRGMMAAAAKFRDDTSGALMTGGTSTAYTISSNQGFISKALMDGVEIAFTVSATNGASPTLNVDSLGADPITLDGVVPVPTGTLIAGSIYTAMYYASGTAWRLKDFYQLPFTVPVGGGMDYWLPTVPNSSFVFPIGQAISRTVYATLFAGMGTTYGVGDGSTTFNLPDKTGRVSAMKEASATRLTTALGGVNGATLGAAGGFEYSQLITANLPPYTPAGSISGVASSVETTVQRNVSNITPQGGGATSVGVSNPGVITVNGNQYTFTGTAQGGTSTKFSIIPPLIVCNYIMRVI